MPEMELQTFHIMKL